jgi:hypothetical protein
VVLGCVQAIKRFFDFVEAPARSALLALARIEFIGRRAGRGHFEHDGFELFNLCLYRRESTGEALSPRVYVSHFAAIMSHGGGKVKQKKKVKKK